MLRVGGQWERTRMPAEGYPEGALALPREEVSGVRPAVHQVGEQFPTAVALFLQRRPLSVPVEWEQKQRACLE
mgnify:CR=1 FL=1